MSRRPIIAAVAALAAVASTAKADDLDKASALIAQSRAALGAEALGRPAAYEFRSTVSIGGLSGAVKSWREIGGLRFAETADIGPFVQADGYDGKSVWNQDGSGLVWVDGGDAGPAETISLALIDNYALWRPDRGGAKVAWGGTRNESGVDYEALVITAPGARAPFELWFDPKTHLPARFVQPMGPKAVIRTYSDYRRAEGLMVAFKTRTTDLQGNDTDMAIVSVAKGADPARLAKPASNVHDFSITGGRSKTRVPMELIDNHVYVSVTLNGKGPYRFILDTGGQNVVDPAVAREIGAAGQGSFQGGGSGSATQELSFAMVGQLGVGEAILKDQQFAVAPTRQGFGVAAGERVDGLIGFEVLARFVTTFDYAHNTVILALPGRGAAPAGETLPFVFNERQPQFACSVDQVAGQCTLDTGARDSITFYGPFVAAHPEIKPAAITAVGVDGFGFGGASFGRLGRVQTLAIGTFHLPNIISDFTADEGGAFASPFLVGNVGGNVWRRFALTLDYGHQRMTLQPNTAFAAEDDYEHAGLFLIERDGKHMVLDARPGAPAAEAGIMKGDVIDTIDGVPASSLSLQALRARFLAAPGVKITLGLVAKDGARRTVVLTLRRFI